MKSELIFIKVPLGVPEVLRVNAARERISHSRKKS